MEIFAWVGSNWPVLLNAVGVVGGLLFTGLSFHSETKTRKVANLLTVTANHRQLWSELLRRPDLGRVLDVSADVLERPVSAEEELFVNLVVQHLNSVFHALKGGLLIKQEGLRRDVGWFFSLPVPRVVWERLRPLQNDAFWKFVESSRCGCETELK